MKLQISKKLKTSVISLLIILISTSSFILFRQVRIPKLEEQTNPVYAYNNKSSVNYEVFLKPNNLYEGNSVDEGQVYITEFVDYIKTNFNYEFSGERDADLKGKYDIVATVEGFTGEGEKFKSIWEKDYIIVKEKKFDIKGTTGTIKEEIVLNIKPYNNFVEEMKEIAKINSQAMVTVAMNINLEGRTDKGNLEEIIRPSLIIPLNTPMFEIGGDLNIDEPGAIEETIQVEIPVNSKFVILNAIIISILSLILILMIFFVKIAPNKNPHERLLKVIFKKHGDRLVALNSDLIINDARTSNVKSIDDLVRIADEIGKPILYKYSDNYEEINKFYVSNEEQVYLLNISEIFIKEEMDSDDGVNSLGTEG